MEEGDIVVHKKPLWIVLLTLYPTMVYNSGAFWCCGSPNDVIVTLLHSYNYHQHHHRITL